MKVIMEMGITEKVIMRSQNIIEDFYGMNIDFYQLIVLLKGARR